MSARDDLDTPFTAAEEAVARDFLEHGLERYGALATPEMLATMAKVGLEGMRTHPVLRRLVRRLAAEPRVDRSGEVSRRGGPDSGEGSAGGGPAT